MGVAAELDERSGTCKRPINARAETVAQLPTFRGAFAKRRAVVVVEAFYEWRRPEGQPKQPFAIARADGSPLALAVLWEGFKGGDRRGNTVVLHRDHAEQPAHENGA